MYPKNVEKTEFCEKCLSAYPKLCLDHDEYLFSPRSVIIFKHIGNDKLMSLNDFYKDRNQHCAVESGISYLWKRIGDGSAYKRFSKKYTLSLKNYILVYAGMFLTCTVGCMLGIFAAGLFRDAKNATLFLVVLFVVFLLFSRLLLFDPEIQNYLGPIYDSRNAIKDILTLDIKKWAMIIPIFASFTSMSRYITNLICCIPFLSTKEYLFEFGILFIVFGIIPLILAIFCISSKRKNWRIISR